MRVKRKVHTTLQLISLSKYCTSKWFVEKWSPKSTLCFTHERWICSGTLNNWCPCRYVHVSNLAVCRLSYSRPALYAKTPKYTSGHSMRSLFRHLPDLVFSAFSVPYFPALHFVPSCSGHRLVIPHSLHLRMSRGKVSSPISSLQNSLL